MKKPLSRLSFQWVAIFPGSRDHSGHCAPRIKSAGCWGGKGHESTRTDGSAAAGRTRPHSPWRRLSAFLAKGNIAEKKMELRWRPVLPPCRFDPATLAKSPEKQNGFQWGFRTVFGEFSRDLRLTYRNSDPVSCKEKERPLGNVVSSFLRAID